MAVNSFHRRNRIRALGSEPVGIEYMRRESAGEATAMFDNRTQGVDSGSPKIANEQGFTYPVIVTNAVTKLLDADLNRTMFSLINNDTLGRVTVSFGIPRPFGIGFPANAGGGGFLLDQHCPTAAIYVVGDIASNANVSYTVR